MKKVLSAFHHRILAAAFVLAALSQPSLPPATVSAASSPPLEGSMLETEEIVVTAARYREGIASVPSKITVITKEEIGQSTAQNIPDLLRSVASVHVSDIAGSRRFFTIDIRGFGETAGLNTLVLVDGRRVNQADLSGTDWTLIPIERVKRIEILHGGGGGVLYGDNASGGVIHIITRKPERPETEAGVVAGSYETFKGTAHIGGNLKDLAYSLSARYFTSDGYRDNSATEAADLGLNLSYFLSDSARLYLGGRYHRDDTGLPGALKESDRAAGRGRRETVNPDDFVEVDDYFLKGGAEITFRGDDFFTIDISYRERDVSTFASFAGGNFTGDTVIRTVIVAPHFVFRNSFEGLANTLTAGLDYHNDEEEILNESLFFGEVTSGSFTLEKENYGLYLQDELEVRDGLFLSGGYRRDRADFSFSPGTPGGVSMDENLYMAGVNYALGERSFLYLGYSRSFRYPVLDEMFDFFTTTINAGLGAQRTDDVEIGVRYHFGGDASVHLNLFSADTKDEIFFNPSTFTNENLDGTARRRGAEISFDARPLGWLALNGSYAYLDSTIDGGTFDGNEVPGVPKNKAVLRAVFLPGMGLTFTVEGIYVGERPFVSDYGGEFGSQEDYALLNGKIEYRRSHLTAFLAVDNALDREYAEYGVLGGFPLEKAFFPSPGRNFSAGLTVGF